MRKTNDMDSQIDKLVEGKGWSKDMIRLSTPCPCKNVECNGRSFDPKDMNYLVAQVEQEAVERTRRGRDEDVGLASKNILERVFDILKIDASPELKVEKIIDFIENQEIMRNEVSRNHTK